MPIARGRPWLLFDAEVTKAIQPGESFTFTWELQTIQHPVRLDSAYGEVFLGNQRLYKTQTVPFVAAQNGDVDTQLQYETVQPPNDPALASALYKVGTQTLEFRVTASGADAPPYQLFSTTFDLPIALPSASDLLNWWDMHAAPDQVTFLPNHSGIAVEWGSNFDLLVTFNNRGAATLNSAFTVTMVNSNDPKDTSTGAVPRGPIPPGFTLSVRLSNIKIGWAFAPFGPYEKIYNFSIFATIDDAFGNVYPPLTIVPGPLPLLAIDVTVPLWAKILDIGLTALALAGAIVVVGAATAIVAPKRPKAVAGAALLDYAESLIAMATTPPAMKANYLEKVAIAPPTIPKKLSAELARTPFADVAGAIGRFSGLLQGLNSIRARLLAARADNNQTGVELQSHSYSEGIRDLSSAAAGLKKSVDDLTRVGLGDLTAPAAAVMAKIRGGKIPSPLRKQCRAAGVTERTIERMAKTIGNPQAKGLLDRGLLPMLGMVGISALRAAAELQRDAPVLLSGDQHAPGATRAPEGALVVPWSKKKSKARPG